ncbi:helix-turn-helix transcriptional regulator [Nonomuraea sp. LPB2021202275-12-8]|uniref:helix-turn-helix transcriptional regulator n=1 Tax=Nonomuraea sp. LPB2021202275-12-8 TaxID=3120159 RepID=UPI00300D8E0C
MTRTTTSITRHSKAGGTRRGRTRSAGDDEWLTLDEVLTKLRISERTWYRWQGRGEGPRSIRLPGNGPWRIHRDWLQEWIDAQEQA